MLKIKYCLCLKKKKHTCIDARIMFSQQLVQISKIVLNIKAHSFTLTHLSVT